MPDKYLAQFQKQKILQNFKRPTCKVLNMEEICRRHLS